MVSIAICESNELADGRQALGISEEVAVLGLKGSKKRKSKKLDEDFIVCTVGCLAHSFLIRLFFISANP